jgi:hypothetical protein
VRLLWLLIGIGIGLAFGLGLGLGLVIAPGGHETWMGAAL